MKTAVLLLAAVALFVVHCSHHQQKSSPEQVSVQKGLTREANDMRSKRVRHPAYALSIDLSPTDKSFNGKVNIDFDLEGSSLPLRIDFQGGLIRKLVVNEVEIKEPDYNGQYVSLPAGPLKEGHNAVQIVFSHPYSTSGKGLERFEDPEDHKVYLYTDFEPYDANQLFPCFDQPDLKGQYTLSVDAPADWKVISSIRETRAESAGAGRKLWTFPQTQAFSTYLFSLHAGPYKVWASNRGGIPLRLFARQAMAKYVQADEWLEVTRSGLEYYGKFFDFAYPFKKYDQIIVPDFNSGAMENVGAVTFSERYVRRGKPTREEREQIASVILHEMAHMWFGDLVTMKWWNDLWLNESFATFMSAKAVEAATPYKKSWESFFRSDKNWAYFEDQMITTHPIEGIVPDTDQAFANFDGITYGKGASVLKQLSFYIGDDHFQKGVQNYFKKFAFKNAELNDFMLALSGASAIDLAPWAKQWLQTAGLNTVKTNVQCLNDKVISFELIQTAPTTLPTLRDHRAEVALYEKSSTDKPTLFKTLDVTYGPQPTSVKEALDLPCPDMVFANHNDFDYAKVQFDDLTLRALQKRISKVPEEFARIMMWSSLWQMVRDSQLTVQQYADLVLGQIPDEKEYKVLASVLATVDGGRWASPNVIYYLPVGDSKAEAARAHYVSKFEELSWQQLGKQNKNPDIQRLWFDDFTRLAQTPQAIAKLAAMVDGSTTIAGFTLDQDRRWDAILTINTFNAELGRKLVEAEIKKDNSNSGHLMAVAAEAARPDLENKRQWFNKLLKDKTIPFNQLRYAMWHLFPRTQQALHEKFTDDFFGSLPEVIKNDDAFQETYSQSLAPDLCTPSTVAKFTHSIDGGKDFSPIVLKNLKIARQEDERCLKVRAFAQSEGVH